jgi:urease accessory protein
VGWDAAIALGFSADGGTTRLAHRRHKGPLCVQRSFHPEGDDVCHVYVLHPPGGLVGGDDLRIDIDVGAGAAALVTTPAAGKAYRSNGLPVRQTQHLEVGAGATLEWLPQETIVYDGAEATFTTRVELAAGARFIGTEAICFGLPARGESFGRGSCRQRFELWRGDRPLFIERGRFDGGSAVQSAAWGLAGGTVIGLLVSSPAPEAVVVDALRGRAAEGLGQDRAAATVLGQGDDEVFVCRYTGGSAERARAFLHDAWRLLRPALTGRAPVAPRIWAT